MTAQARHRIEAVKVAPAGMVQVGWADGHESRFPAIWLRYACTCAHCGETETAVRHLRLTELPADPNVEAVSMSDAGDLLVDWGGGHVSRFDPFWLRGHCLSQQERERRRVRPRVWGREIADELPYRSYSRTSADPDAHLEFLETLRDLGFVILTEVPPEAERIEEVAGLAGKLRMTNYGVFELRSKPDPEIVGDMALALNLHSDEPYRRDPPAITFFQVIAQSAEGGDTTLADGLHVAERLREQDPEAFRLLASTPARFHRTLKEGRAFEMEAPIISLDRDGAVAGIRILDRGMAPVDAAPEQVGPFFAALRKLLALLYAGEGMITVKLAPGQMLVFNNQRLLHGRTAFDPARSERHVRSFHVDLDEFHSRLRHSYRSRGREEQWMSFGRGAAP